MRLLMDASKTLTAAIRIATCFWNGFIAIYYCYIDFVTGLLYSFWLIRWAEA